MTDKVISDGVRYVDRSTGEEKWMSGDMLLAHVRQAVAAERKKWKAEMGHFATYLGKRFVEERRRHAEEVRALREELAELRKALPLRAVGGRSAVG